MNVNETVERTTYDVVEISVVLNLSDPTLVNPTALFIDTFNDCASLNRLWLRMVLALGNFLFLLCVVGSIINAVSFKFPT